MQKVTFKEMNLKLYIMLGVLYAFSFIGCDRKPSANFTSDKSIYTGGDDMLLRNTSVDAVTSKWTFFDGQTRTTKDVYFSLDENIPSGNYSVKLEAFSIRGKKSSEITKTFTINQAKGQLVVWSSNTNAGPISVKVDNVAVGTVTLTYLSNPAYGADGCVNLDIKTGMHLVSATDGSLTWSDSIMVFRDRCSNFDLY